jgi:hypothetical protein
MGVSIEKWIPHVEATLETSAYSGTDSKHRLLDLLSRSPSGRIIAMSFSAKWPVTCVCFILNLGRPNQLTVDRQHARATDFK